MKLLKFCQPKLPHYFAGKFRSQPLTNPLTRSRSEFTGGGSIHRACTSLREVSKRLRRTRSSRINTYGERERERERGKTPCREGWIVLLLRLASPFARKRSRRYHRSEIINQPVAGIRPRHPPPCSTRLEARRGRNATRTAKLASIFED